MSMMFLELALRSFHMTIEQASHTRQVTLQRVSQISGYGANSGVYRAGRSGIGSFSAVAQHW